MEIVVSFPGGKRVDARVGEHLIRTDQSRQDGGEGSAPEPFLYLLAALATCAGHYVRSYLQARRLPLSGLELVQENQFDEKAHRLARVRIEVRLPEGVPEKHRQVIKRAVNLCAVKKVLESPPEFVVDIK